MSKVQWKGGTFIYPIPAVMVSCGTMEKSNIITVAWTGILNTNPAMCYISVRPERYSHNIIKENGEFAINLTTRQLAYATDWCGVKSGRDVDKFKYINITLLLIFYKLYFNFSACFGHSLIQFKHKIHSVPFFLFLELSNISTFIGQFFIHLLQLIHSSLLHIILI